MKLRSRDTPQLLVSVRSAAEARIALVAGCDLIDVKEPSRGSLGSATSEIINAICAAVGDAESTIPVSVALGELCDVRDPSQAIAALPGEVEFAKLGLAGCANRVRWVDHWMQVRRAYDEAAERPIGWIAVHYADGSAAGPPLHELIDAAAATGCRGLLIDTYLKDGRGLFEHASLAALTELRRQTERRGLLFAVAGSLRADDLPRLAPSHPDIVAVRGAACAEGARDGLIDGGAVQRLRMQLKTVFAGRCGS